MSRTNYAIKTVASAAHLLASCQDDHVTNTIMARTTQMLNNVWKVEHSNLKATTPPEHLPIAIRAFWDEVSAGLVTTIDRHCYSFQAIHGEQVNPPGQEGNVHIQFQAYHTVSFFVTTLSIQPT
ncbi:MAG: hypothetical protein ACOYB3_01205 [Azonexus sp.]